MVTMGDPIADLTPGVDPSVEHLGRNSPASAVCYMGMDIDMHETSLHSGRESPKLSMAASELSLTERDYVEAVGLATQTGEESDCTPRSEVPSISDASTADPQQQLNVAIETGFFSPQPLRVYSRKLPTSTSASMDSSPTSSVNASSTSVYATCHNPPDLPTTLADPQDRPSVQRDLSSTSTVSVATVRAHSVDPVQNFSPPTKQYRDGPHYPNQSYAALQSQHYPPPYSALPYVLRTRSSHPSHYSSHSVAQISTFGLSHEQSRDIMDSGSRTVGNSPASSPGLFIPTTPPLRTPQSDEHGHSSSPYLQHGYYSSPYLHHTHRQAPKETHVADVDVDPVSGRKIINQYEVIDELGRGVHGKVKLGRNLETGVFVAIKIVDRYSKRRRLGKNGSHEDKIKREIAILKKARHPNIVSLLEVIDDPSRKKVYIVLEHVELGEVKWRTEAAKEIALVEWRRYQRESEGIFDNDNAAMEDERIITRAHQSIARRQRRRAKEMQNRQLDVNENGAWSFEFGGDSEDEVSESGRDSRASTGSEDRPPSRLQWDERHQESNHRDTNMETAIRSTTPTAGTRQEDSNIATTGLEGTMYGPYDTELIRGRTPSLAGSSSSHFTEPEDVDVPEHFRYVPLMTIQAARETFRDTVLGLEYLHYQGVIHRDIKPANLLQTKEHRIKISDFGVSYLGRQSHEDGAGDQSESDVQDADEAIELAKTVGTPAFYAPELCRTDLDADTPPVTGKIDIFALGVTLYCLIYGRVPFHDNNTFVLMRVITDTEAYIPRYRLKAVAEKSGSRPNSHGRMYHSMTSSKRAPHDLDYEEVDENLRDLLNKLLIKDPRKRISIKEIKRHPWLLQGIDNFNSWVEETDPGKSSQGRRIEVSKDELDKAVVPITLIDRVRSGVRKTLDTVLRMGTRGGSRRRAQSTATNPEQASISAHSSSSTISQESRRPSLAAVNQSIFDALRLSREPEHPLSQSVTASPEASERANFFEGPSSRTASPAHSVESNELLGPLTGRSRPHPSERSYSTNSSTASVRTIRPSDPSRIGTSVSPHIPSALPGTPTALDTPGGSNLGGIFGGVPRRLVNSVRSRERMLKPPRDHLRAKSIDRLVGTDDDPHSGPSIALSNAFAAGHVDQPDILKDISPTIGPSGGSDQHFPRSTGRGSSRQSSVSSVSSHPPATCAVHETEVRPMGDINMHTLSTLQRGTSDDTFSRAKDEFRRRRVVEENQGRERPHSMNFQRPISAMSQTDCPPSPDDEIFHRQNLDQFFNGQPPSHYHSIDMSPASYPVSANSPQSTGLTPSSSEDQFTSMSQSTSNPSIPSVMSADSSVTADDCPQINPLHEFSTSASNTMDYFEMPHDDLTGYDGDDALESEEDDEDSEEEDFIVMTKRKSNTQGLTRSGSISNAQLARQSVRKEVIASRRRSERSGSNGTVKKIRAPWNLLRNALSTFIHNRSFPSDLVIIVHDLYDTYIGVSIFPLRFSAAAFVPHRFLGKWAARTHIPPSLAIPQFVCTGLSSVLMYKHSVTPFRRWRQHETVLFLSTCFQIRDTKGGVHDKLTFPATFPATLLSDTRDSGTSLFHHEVLTVFHPSYTRALGRKRSLQNTEVALITNDCLTVWANTMSHNCPNFGCYPFSVFLAYILVGIAPFLLMFVYRKGASRRNPLPILFTLSLNTIMAKLLLMLRDLLGVEGNLIVCKMGNLSFNMTISQRLERRCEYHVMHIWDARASDYAECSRVTVIGVLVDRLELFADNLRRGWDSSRRGIPNIARFVFDRVEGSARAPTESELGMTIGGSPAPTYLVGYTRGSSPQKHSSFSYLLLEIGFGASADETRSLEMSGKWSSKTPPIVLLPSVFWKKDGS
ncbi:uncharacterized protein BDR25DRAFT_359119 [Lindgomyces ingoldianus]|uniref:Uncharacterized protein n=1 Tax=Lindgomyces ingoldianus TaxID=673940 RepID=A0ACB6QJI3_9PLEO|nr:uncharacterized protein BDR25DRAFT_359119 [Lindgomyces ingoldianus]KAF2467086.1 hypothetical protein BDR25DRAFT_359119 [Lindgomyces ingoldianus]